MRHPVLRAGLKIIGLAILFSPQAQAFNFFNATPVGSWQVREDITTDHKGKQTAAVIRSSVVDSEMRDGEQHYWIEMEIESYKIKKNGDRKKEGDTMIMKSLVSESTLQSDPENVINNLRGFGKEIIIQNGNQDPMMISDGGAMADAMLSAMGTEINFDYQKIGGDSVSVPAGSFDCTRYEGSGTTTAKIMIKTIRVESETSMCLSEKIPFGMIEASSTSVTNGKESSSTTKMLDFGKAGAVTKITKTPQQAPSFSNMFN